MHCFTASPLADVDQATPGAPKTSADSFTNKRNLNLDLQQMFSHATFVGALAIDSFVRRFHHTQHTLFDRRSWRISRADCGSLVGSLIVSTIALTVALNTLPNRMNTRS